MVSREICIVGAAVRCCKGLQHCIRWCAKGDREKDSASSDTQSEGLSFGDVKRDENKCNSQNNTLVYRIFQLLFRGYVSFLSKEMEN